MKMSLKKKPNKKCRQNWLLTRRSTTMCKNTTMIKKNRKKRNNFIRSKTQKKTSQKKKPARRKTATEKTKAMNPISKYWVRSKSFSLTEWKPKDIPQKNSKRILFCQNNLSFPMKIFSQCSKQNHSTSNQSTLLLS